MFDGEAENFRHWKSEFLILNGQEHLEYLVGSTRELENDESRLTGYEKIAAVLDPAKLTSEQDRINRENPLWLDRHSCKNCSTLR